MICWKLFFATLIAFVHSSEAQLSTNEVIKNVTRCDLNAVIRLDCGTNAVIVIHSLQYVYNVSCETTCCSYSNTDCFVYAEANDIKEIRRLCSGRKSCNVSISTDKTYFTTCSLGVKPISYVFVQYYCIAEARIQSICSNGELLSSANNPVYLTNEGYPGVTTGAMSCSCSVEIFSCNSNINLYISDADLYSDTSNCKQNINFNDPDNKTLTTIGCEDRYGNQLETVLLDSHYVEIDFTSSSTENLEGYFFVGFDTSVSDVSFKLTCSSQPETWCAGCVTVPIINNGNVTLNKEDDVSFEATANVTCDSGYDTDTSYITCQANGTWSSTECTAKRCGTVPTINNGNVTLNKEDDDSFGATANVTCDSGYETGTTIISCQANATWPTPECTEKRCGRVPTINNGNVQLNKENDDSFGATANVTCDLGYETNTSTITCQASGTWPTPECTEKPACSVDQWRCDNGDCISNASKCDNIPDCSDESDEQICSGQICPEGMKACPHSNGSSVCVNDGISCDCGSVPLIDNGNISLNGNSTIGAVADVTCNEGYNPSNPNVTCLETGSWETASCSPEDCGSLPSLSFGHYKLVNGTSTVFGASAKVVCDSGYTSETSTIKCQSSGQWETTVCHKIDCGSLPSLSFGHYKLVNGTSTVFGASAKVVCDSGYTSETSTINCQSSGQWETTVCHEIDCGPLPSISFGQYQLVNASRTVFGASAKVVCDPGYTSSTFNITCQSSGQWESAVCSKETKPPPTPTTKKDSGIDTTTIIVIVIVLVLLAQLLFMCYLQCKIYNIRETASNGHSEIHKRILMTVLGSIPIVGLVPIYLTWKVFYRDVYKGKHNHDNAMINRNGYSNNIDGSGNEHGLGQSSDQNTEFSELS